MKVLACYELQVVCSSARACHTLSLTSFIRVLWVPYRERVVIQVNISSVYFVNVRRRCAFLFVLLLLTYLVYEDIRRKDYTLLKPTAYCSSQSPHTMPFSIEESCSQFLTGRAFLQWNLSTSSQQIPGPFLAAWSNVLHSYWFPGGRQPYNILELSEKIRTRRSHIAR